MSERPLALRHVQAVDDRERTRIVCVYGLSAPVPGSPGPDKPRPVTDVYRFDRFSRHITDASDLLPRPVIVSEVNIEFPGHSLDLRSALAVLLVAPRGDAALVVDAEMNGDQTAQRVAEVLDVTCQERESLRVDGKTVTEWLRDEAGKQRAGPLDGLTLGRNVHQCVFPGGALLKSILQGDTYWRLIYRISAPYEPEQHTGTFRQPQELNYPEYVAVGHGRGVSVISGFARSWENTFALVAIMSITALGVLHRSRRSLFETMKNAGEPSATRTDRTRNEISRLAAQLNELQLDLEFGVEPYLDSVLIPESFVEAFQRSLCEAMGVPSGLEHSSRMLERLSSIIQVRRAELDAAIQEQAEKMDKRFSLVLALGTVFALPPALLLAYFTLGSGGSRTLDPHVHLVAYLVAFVPFIVLVVIGVALRNWIRPRPTQLEVFERERASRAR